MAATSIGTVDRVLHNRPGVSEITRERVQKVLKKHNYRPNLIARSLASCRKYILGVLIPYSTEYNSYWAGPLEGIEKAGSETYDYGIEIRYFFFDQYDIKSFTGKAGELLNTKPDGILIAPIFFKEGMVLAKRIEREKIPYVFIDSNIKGLNNISYFGQDSFQSGYLAAKLISFGSSAHSKYLVIHIAEDSENINHLKQRENGFRKWFNKRNSSIESSVHTVFFPGGKNIIEQKIFKIIESKGIQGAFITSNAHRVAKYFEKNKPDNFKVIGYDMTMDNLKYLKSGTIDFLICQKPREQGYFGLLSLFNYLVHKKPVKPVNHMPIDIITRENYAYYLEFE